MKSTVSKLKASLTSTTDIATKAIETVSKELDEATDVDQASVCSIVVPTREELQEKVSKQTEESFNKFKTFFSELTEE